MKKNILRAIVLFSIAFGFSGTEKIHAQNGQPHSLKADVTFSDVTLSWKKPTDNIILQWHDDEDYNGMDGVLKDPEGSIEFYAASKFSASELAAYAGQTITDVRYWEYREAYKASVVIFEDGTPVYEQAADLAGFEKNSWRNVKFDTPYTIPEGKEVLISIKYSYGRNLDMVAICDRAPTYGKGNLYSYDGETWHSDGPGDFLITAVLANNSTGEPKGYNVYRDGEKVNGELIADATSYTLNGETDGQHEYQVSAVYDADEKISAKTLASTLSVYGCMPPVPCISGKADNLSGTITWGSPLKRGAEMTWSGKEVSNGIGGTSSTSPKVWIKHEFSATDMAAFPDHQITAINAYVFNDGTINSVTAFIMKDGVIDYFEEVSADMVTAIKTNEWNKFALQKPYKMEIGHGYAFGLYYTHTAKGHPVGVDNTEAIEVKGNSFSTSSPSSKGFAESSPYWKTLSEGKIPGNFMLSADVEALSSQASEPQNITGYDIYRDGELVAENVAGPSYTDVVSDLGTYQYAVVTKGEGGKKSDAETAYLTYTLPEEYKAPTIVNNSQDGKNINIAWSSNAYELKHYGRATYIAGFAEEMPLLYGARFTKEELAEYAGFKFHSLTFGLGDNLDEFKLKIIAEGGEVLYEKQLTKNDITPGYLYTLDFEGEIDVKVPEGKDIYLAYEATLPANTTPILLDAGPEAEGGAVVNLAGGAGSWLNLSTIASDYKGMNVVIGALIIDDNSAQSPSKVKAARLSSVKLNGNDMERVIIKTKATTDAEGMEFGICTAKEPAKAAAANADKPKVKSYRIYRNGDMLLETTETSYAETLTEYGIIYYYVTSVYENGWESPASDLMTFRNTIAQRTQAPYDLRGAVDGKNLNLTWKPVSEAPVLTYENGSGNYMAFGMTGSNVVEGYMVIKFPAAEMADKVGQEISHINFRLNSTDLQTAAAVIMYGDNVVYMQDINVSTLNVGANTVRLNKPVKVIEGKDIGVGYHLSYMSGVKPLVCDDGPTVADYYSDLISASGTPGYWKSMNKDYKFNYNWAISATIKAADQKIDTEKASAPEADGVTYTVYRDGMPIQTGLTATSFVVENAANGIYTVTATTGEDESAESNSVEYGETTGITSLTDDGSDSLKKGDIYTVDGQIAARNGDTSKLKKGVYIMNGKKFVVK